MKPGVGNHLPPAFLCVRYCPFSTPRTILSYVWFGSCRPVPAVPTSRPSLAKARMGLASLAHRSTSQDESLLNRHVRTSSVLPHLSQRKTVSLALLNPSLFLLDQCRQERLVFQEHVTDGALLIEP